MNGARALLGDADTGWHVRTGEWILAHGHVPTLDIFSFTRPDQPWFAWEWLADILMALAHRAGGLPAVVLGSVLLICLTALLLYRLVLRQCGNALVAFAVTAVATAGSAIHWLARPHLFTLLFLVVFYSALQTRPLRQLWPLPLLMAIWTNLHGGFFIGISLIGVYAAGQWTEALMTAGASRAAALKKGNGYALLAAACTAASFVNPYTWRLHRHLFEYLTHPGYFQDIQEFQPLSFGHPLAHFYEPMLIAASASSFWHLRRKNYAAFILMILWAHLSLLASRNVPIFLLLAAPPVAVGLTESLRRIRPANGDGWLARFVKAGSGISAILARAGLRPTLYIFGGSVLVLVAVGMFAAAPPPMFRAEFDPALYPEGALAELRSTDRVFTDDEWGDYLIYRAYPARKVFVDGRSDFYAPDFERQYLDILRLRGDWKKGLDSFQIDTVLARAGGPLSAALQESAGWKKVHEDNVAVIFRRFPVL
jgi:hypothetical protein